MSDINDIIARNLASLRKEKHLTLQELAELTGVSKSMLGEIERASSSPTINILWKIITGLKVPISRLIHDQESTCSHVRAEERKVLLQPPKCIRLIFECDHTRSFEVYQLEFEAGLKHSSASHDLGVLEYVMVYEGEFTIGLGEREYLLKEGDSMFFEAECVHSYANRGKEIAKAFSIIYYSKS